MNENLPFCRVSLPSVIPISKFVCINISTQSGYVRSAFLDRKLVPWYSLPLERRTGEGRELELGVGGNFLAFFRIEIFSDMMTKFCLSLCCSR